MKIKIKLWQLIAVLLGTALVAAIAVAVTLLIGRTSNETELPVVDNIFAEIESSEMLETNFVEESMPEPVASEQETELVSTEDEQSSEEVETSIVSNTTEQSHVSETKETEAVERPNQNQTAQPPVTNRPSQGQTTTRPSQNQTEQSSVTNRPSQSQTAQPSNKPEQPTKQELIPVGVAIAQTEGGEATANGQTSLVIWKGMTVTLVAEPKEGYEFDIWYVNGQPYSNLNPALITPLQDAGVLPIYKKVVPPSNDNGGNGASNSNGSNSSSDDKPQQKPNNKKNYTVKVEQAEGGSATANGKTKVTVQSGKNVALKAKPDKYHYFDGWQVGGKLISKENPYNYKVTGNVTIKPIFKAIYRLRVEVKEQGMGTLKVTENSEELLKEIHNYQYTNIKEDARVTVTANPFEGYALESWIVDRKEISAKSNTYSFTASADCDVVAVLVKEEPTPEEKSTLTVTTDGSGEGYIFINDVRQNKVTLPRNTKVLVEAFAIGESEFVIWSDGVRDNPRTVTLDSENVSLRATFEKKSVKPEDTAIVTLAVKTGKGTVAMNGKTATKWTVEKGTRVSFEADAEEGYQFGGFTADKLMDNPYAVTVNDDLEIEVYFNELVTVTLDAQEGGHVEHDGKTVSTLTVVKGSEVPVSAVADDDKVWHFIGWDGDTEFVKGTSSSVTIKADRNIYLRAKFEKRTEYTLTLRMEGGDATVTLDGKTVDFVDGTAELKVTASRYELETTPKAGYRFGSYKNAHGVVITTSPKRTITIANDTIITVELVNEVQREVTYKVRGSIFHTDYVEPGQAPENFYSEGMDNLGDDVFKGWILKNENKFFEGVAGSADFVNPETKENLSDAIKRITQTSDVTLEASLQAKEVYCTLSIEESMELVGAHDTKEVDGVVCYRKGSSISLRIKADYSNPDKPYFSHWEVTGIGKAGMNPEELIFTIHENTVVTATWSAVEVDKEPVVTMTTGDIIPDKGISNVRVDYEVPGGYSVNQVGIQMSVNGGEMAEKVSKNPSNPNATSGFQGWAGLLMEDQMKEGAVVKLRPYIILVGNGSEDYAYGAIAEFDFSTYKAEEEDEDVQLLSEEVEPTEQPEIEDTSEETSETEESSEEETSSEETSEEDDSETEEASETTDTATEENSEAVESTTEETTETSEPDSTPVTTEEETEPESSITVETSEPVADSSEFEETVEEEDSSTEEESEEQSEPEDGNTETVNIEAIVKEDDN